MTDDRGRSGSVDRFLEQIQAPVEATLDEILPSRSEPPALIHAAMRYAVFPGGKRLRPALCLAAFQAFRSDWETVLPVAGALELIHTYSLVHDDLPAMDDDDFRRGRPSCHREFGEAIAILAGDALLTLAFETVARQRGVPAERLLRVAQMLGDAAGTRGGMIGGQVLDLEAQGADADAEGLEAIHRAKTGALLAASIAIGAYLADADEAQLARVTDFGRKIGLAFQIVDDVLDETAPVAALGKTPGKDREQGKATYAATFGVEASRDLVSRLTREARDSIGALGTAGNLLSDFAAHLEGRVH